MEEKRSRGVTTLAFFEMGVGMFGTSLLILFSAISILSNFSSSLSSEVEIGRNAAKYLAIMLTPSLLIWISGEGLLCLKSWSRKINLFVFPLLAIFISILWFNSGCWQPIVLPLVIFWGFIISETFFLSRPKVKEQFK